MGHRGPVGVAVAQASGDVYASSVLGILEFDANLSPLGTVVDPGDENPGQIAVDPTNGDLLFADTEDNLIRRYESDGTPAGSFAAERPVAIAVNSAGAIYVVTTTGDIAAGCGPTSSVVEFSSAGVEEGVIGASLNVPGSVAIDPDNDAIVIASNVNEYFCEQGNLPRISIFDPAGTELESTTLNNMWAAVPGVAAAGGNSSRIYAVTRSPVNDSFGATQITALASSLPEPAISSVTPEATGATLEATLDPHGIDTDWVFQYRLAGAEPWIEGPEGEAPGADGPVSLTRSLTGLKPNRDYEVRLQAENADGLRVSPVETFHTLTVRPAALATAASELAPTTALLNGKIEPYGVATTFWFEYSTAADFSGALSIPVAQNGSAGEGHNPVWVSRKLTGLAPATTYWFRLRASSAAGDSTSPAASFATRSSTPSAGRVYEMVSPVDKNGISVLAQDLEGSVTGPFLAGDSGDSMIFSATNGFPGGGNGNAFGLYRATRGTSSWSTESINPTLTPGNFPGTSQVVTVGFDANLENWTLAPQRMVPPVPGGGTVNFYRYRVGSGYEVLDGAARDSGAYAAEFGGASADYDHVLFSANAVLTDEGEAEDGSRYLYTNDDGQIHLVGILPEGELAPFPQTAGDVYSNMISADGRRVFFASQGQLYLRIDHTSTVRISAPEPGVVDPAGPLPAEFARATADGRYAFFLSSERLTEDANTGPANLGNDLYRYDTATGELTDLAPLATGNGAEVVRAAAVSDDGQSVYFVARGELVPGEGTAGEPNLYLWRDGEVRFIGTTDLNPECDANATGDVFAFTSKAPLTGYDNVNPETGEAEAEAFVYYADSESLVCASCRPSGRPPAGPTELFVATPGSAQGGLGMHRPNFVAEDGTVFFQTYDQVVSGDTNAKIDVYSYAGGEPRLVSTGRSGDHTTFAGASTDGRSVFLLTRERLVGWDVDNLRDAYVARIGGGLPVPPVVVPCQGDACQGEAPPPPSAARPPTATHGAKQAKPCESRLGKQVSDLRVRLRTQRETAKQSSGTSAKRLKKQARATQKRLNKAQKNLRQCRNGK